MPKKKPEPEIEIDLSDAPRYLQEFHKRIPSAEITAKIKADFAAGKALRAGQLAKQKTAMDELIALGLSEESARLLAGYYEKPPTKKK